MFFKKLSASFMLPPFPLAVTWVSFYADESFLAATACLSHMVALLLPLVSMVALLLSPWLYGSESDIYDSLTRTEVCAHDVHVKNLGVIVNGKQQAV